MRSNLSHTVPGARVVDKREIPSMGEDVIKGLSLVEGSFPVDHMNPALKHLVHYGSQTGSRGILNWFSMFVFERNNKRVKSFCHSPSEPLSAVVNRVEIDIKTRKEILLEKTPIDYQCVSAETLSLRCRVYVLSRRQKDDLRMMGVTSFHDFKAFQIAKVFGVHFRSDQWGCRRCSSVITTVHGGVSRYCIVNKFFMIQGKAYAAVTWLSIPVYPCPPFKIVVKVRLMTPEQQLLCPSVIPVDRIQPCTVSVLPASDGIYFYMMRDRGIDR